ncbi:glycosyltransferase family 4 protein [Bizionia sp. KMM 8389]
MSQLCRLLGVDYIPILHGGDLPRRLEDSPKLSALLFKPAKHLVSPSLYLQSVFNDYGYADVVYIPNSLELQRYAFAKKSYGTIRMLWVRSFSEIYNPQLAVRVLKGLQDIGYSCSLCMVGPDTGDGSLEAVKTLADDLAVSVTFTGKLSKTAWLALAADYNVFINTTNFDNMPVSVLEAMALGLPIVSTDVGGLPYLISSGETGMLVPAADTQAFVAAIQDLVADPEAAEAMAVRARNMVAAFDWPAVQPAWMAVLEG